MTRWNQVVEREEGEDEEDFPLLHRKCRLMLVHISWCSCCPFRVKVKICSACDVFSIPCGHCLISLCLTGNWCASGYIQNGDDPVGPLEKSRNSLAIPWTQFANDASFDDRATCGIAYGVKAELSCSTCTAVWTTCLEHAIMMHAKRIDGYDSELHIYQSPLSLHSSFVDCY